MKTTTPQFDLKSPGAVLLLSCYELGHQPQGLALTAAFLEEAGYQPASVDLSVETLTDAHIDQAACVALSVPMHTALRLGRRVAQRVRARNPACRIVFFGHYALLHARSLLAAEADAVLGGEWEADLLRLLAGDERSMSPTVAAASLEKLAFPVPQRRALPALSAYAHLQIAGEHRLAGYVETTRGCRHLCRHCPVPAVYQGRLFAIPRETVLQDAEQQVQAGAQHLTFGDADFFNAPGHGVRVVHELHRRFPHLTFDFTAKVEHLIRHAQLLPALGEAGVVFVVTAVETLNDAILEILDKGHSSDDVRRAQRALQEAGIAMRPSLMPFTPWTQRRDLPDILHWVAETDLIASVDAVQYSMRLLVPHGSLLEKHDAWLPHRGDYDEEGLTDRWKHADEHIDALQRQVAQVAESASQNGESLETTFDRVWDLVHDTTSKGTTPSRGRQPGRRRHQRPPRLTEPWFC